MIFFCGSNVGLPPVLNSLTIKHFLIYYMISKLTVCEVAARSILPRPGGPIFPRTDRANVPWLGKTFTHATYA